MGDVLPFKRKSLKEKHKGNTLCRNGFHKWEVVKSNVFGVKHGRLVTVKRCSRCGKQENKLT